MYYVYVLESQKDKKFYTGLTWNIGKRLQEHNSEYPGPQKEEGL